jgi:hypothetical protein
MDAPVFRHAEWLPLAFEPFFPRNLDLPPPRARAQKTNVQKNRQRYGLITRSLPVYLALE